MIEITAYGQSKGEAAAKVTITEMLLNGELTKSEDTAVQIARLINGVQVRRAKNDRKKQALCNYRHNSILD